MENVIRIEDIPGFVERTISAVRDGIALARKSGVLAELPKEIQFDMTVIGTWQSADLAVISTDTSNGIDNGGSVTISEGTGNVISNDTSTSEGTSSSAGTSFSNDTSTSEGTSSSAGTSSSNDASTSEGTQFGGGSRSGSETSDSSGNDGSNSAGQNNSYSYTQ